MEQQLDTIVDAIEAIRNGEVIIVVDDEDRENEGDFICAAESITPEIINFMATHGRGLICAPLIETRCDELGLQMMVTTNSASYETPFTVSVDLNGHGCTTGISAGDRAKTVKALIDPEIHPSELGKPGHIFPLRAKVGGVLRRAGHTEAAIDFARLAGKEPAGVIVEIMNEDGTMARLPQLQEIAKKFDMKLVSIQDLIAYRLENETLIEHEMEVNMPTKYGDFKLHAFRQTTNQIEHLALVKGTWKEDEAVLVRVHSSSMVGDIFGSEQFGRGEQLHRAMEIIEERGKGVIVYINKLREGHGIVDELRAYQNVNKQGEENQSAAAPAKMDNKDFGIGAQILRHLGVRKINLMTNNPRRMKGIVGYGLEIVESETIAVKQKA
ncbi:MAG: 3,4-dihydroxy 2-butanone 4-phosphate synthase/GTP cyclohydrolase II [Flavobacteriales bacterium]|jgi:3,4-dihydroxy 2-butanone 4-phosphate synthase/GTP cyclohydrolase II